MIAGEGEKVQKFKVQDSRLEVCAERSLKGSKVQSSPDSCVIGTCFSKTPLSL